MLVANPKITSLLLQYSMKFLCSIAIVKCLVCSLAFLNSKGWFSPAHKHKDKHKPTCADSVRCGYLAMFFFGNFSNKRR